MENDSTTLDLPIIDLRSILNHDQDFEGKKDFSHEVLVEAKNAFEALSRYGILIVRDPRASEVDNDQFLNLMEQYFGQSDISEKDKDVRSDVYFQVGRTPSHTELPRNHCERVKTLDDKPLSLCPPELDPKERFMWRIGPTPPTTQFPQLNAAPVVPSAFKDIWKTTMDTWGTKLLDAAISIAELIAIAAKLPDRSTLSTKMRYGPHLLAPTGSDLSTYGAIGTVLAGYHYDLNALTVHGKSRFPGLYIWTRDGKRKIVKIPNGCLLVQAGKQLEHITAGTILAGFHEVVVTEQTSDVISIAKQNGKSLWRISSTLFAHFASDESLAPLEAFGTMESRAKFENIKVGDHVNAELAAINLGEGSSKRGAL
jgi:isopenicillin N synthase-like dioxygenase